MSLRSHNVCSVQRSVRISRCAKMSTAKVTVAVGIALSLCCMGCRGGGDRGSKQAPLGLVMQAWGRYEQSEDGVSLLRWKIRVFNTGRDQVLVGMSRSMEYACDWQLEPGSAFAVGHHVPAGCPDGNVYLCLPPTEQRGPAVGKGLLGESLVRQGVLDLTGLADLDLNLVRRAATFKARIAVLEPKIESSTGSVVAREVWLDLEAALLPWCGADSASMNGRD